MFLTQRFSRQDSNGNNMLAKRFDGFAVLIGSGAKKKRQRKNSTHFTCVSFFSARTSNLNHSHGIFCTLVARLQFVPRQIATFFFSSLFRSYINASLMDAKSC